MIPGSDFEKAVLGMVKRSPGCASRGIATRLVWSGFANSPSPEFTRRIFRILDSLAERGEVVKDDRVNEVKWWPKGTNITPGGVL